MPKASVPQIGSIDFTGAAKFVPARGGLPEPLWDDAC